MVQDPLKRNYVIAQQELNRIGIINRQGKVLFEKDYITSNEMDVQYYRFGTGVELVAVTDPMQGLTYLYDGTGKFINFQPLTSNNKIALLYKFEKYHVYTTFQNSVSIYRFSY